MPTYANDTNGLNHIQWSRWKTDLLVRGTYNPERWDELSGYQKRWTQDTLTTLKKLST